MFVVKRRPGESVMVGDQVRFTVLSVKGRQVKVGVDSPPELPVDREEIYLAKRERRELPSTETPA